MATQEQKTVAFVLYPGLTLLDLVGPLQVFASLRQFNDQYRPVVVAERIEPMATDGPLTVTADRTFGDVLHRGAGPGRGRAAGGPPGHHPLGLPPPAGTPGRHLPAQAVGGGRQVRHLGRGLGRDRPGPGPGRPPHRRGDRPDGAAGDRVRPPPAVWGHRLGQVDRDIYEPVLGPMLQQQLADRPELLAKLSG